MRGMDPVKMIREAIAKTLVFYYPLAGRLREGPNRKLMVECTGEGIYFIEADAEVRLDEFRDVLQPPFPCFEELLFDVPASSGVLNSPLILISGDGGLGIAQFLCAVSEIARGSHSPSILPWERHLLDANEPPRVTHQHREYKVAVTNDEDSTAPLNEELVELSFFFGSKEISTLKSLVSHRHRHHITFEILIACVWKCRTAVLQLNPNEDVRLMYTVDARKRFNPPLPIGYYGNGFVFPVTVTTAGKLSQNPLEYVVELVKAVKAEVTEEHVRSVAALMVSKGRPLFTTTRSFIVSDVTRVGFQDLDFGLGRPLYTEVPKAGAGDFPVLTFLGLSTNKKGEKGIVVPLRLPAKVMERFVIELQNIMKNQPNKRDAASKFVTSSL